jgi:hypothetical protein
MYVIDLPFDYIRKITMPPCEEEKYSKKWAAVTPLFGLLFIILVCYLQIT